MMNNLFKNYEMSNVGFYLLIIATLGDMLIPFILAPFCYKYHHLTMVMSLLGNRNTPVHIVYNAWLVIAGIMFICGSFTLYTYYAKISTSVATWLFIVLLIYAVGGCILSGIFPVGETKELLTISETIHGYGSVLGFSILTSAPLIVTLLSMRSNELTIGILSFIMFILSFSFFVLFVMADKEKYAGIIISNEGLWQRLSLLCMYVPIIIVSFKRVL